MGADGRLAGDYAAASSQANGGLGMNVVLLASRAGVGARRWGVACLVLLSLLAGGCSTVYVDGGVTEAPVSGFVRPASPQPVQLVFEFQTKGVSNAQATAHLKTLVKEQVTESGLFAAVSDEPVSGGALLTLTMNNVPLNDDAMGKAFLAGFTFGLAGTVVGDGYESQLRYSARPGVPPAPPLQQKHAIYLKIGASGPPPNAVEVEGLDAAVKRMVRQTLSRLLDGLSRSAAFRGQGPDGGPATPSPTPSATASTTPSVTTADPPRTTP